MTVFEVAGEIFGLFLIVFLYLIREHHETEQKNAQAGYKSKSVENYDFSQYKW